jgi:hypothetical protein
MIANFQRGSWLAVGPASRKQARRNPFGRTDRRRAADFEEAPMAVSAHVITMGIENDMNGNIKAWFKQFNFLPPIPLTAAQVDTVSHDLSFEHLLELVLQSTFTNFILIIHGQPDGSGLYLPLFTHSSKYSTFHYDLQKLMDVDANVSTMSEADFRIMGFAPLDHHTKASLKQHNRKDPRQERVDKMLDLMHRVQSKKIDCIEFRSCNLGRNVLSLQRFREFFGARLAGAPDLHTVFGRTDTRVGQNFLDMHMRMHPLSKDTLSWETYKFPSALGNPRLVACFGLNKDMKPESAGHIVADTTATFDSWVQQYIMPTGRTSGKEIAMHCLWVADYQGKSIKGGPSRRPVAIIAGDTSQPLSWGKDDMGTLRFVPPLSDDYKRHIVYSRR